MTTATTKNAETTDFAWVSLARLCGCNYRVPVTRKGKSVIVPDPQHDDQRYRINAAEFDAGHNQVRRSWCIEKWSEKAARITASERDFRD